MKRDDFFPYASDPYSYWTGYFTSRPTSKRMERVANQFLQVTKQLSASAKVRESFYEVNLNRLRRMMGVMQHHDAITGTEKQHVADDYHRGIHASMIACEDVTRSSLNQLLTGVDKTRKFQFNSCLNLNISRCDVTENSGKFMVTVYNPLAHFTSQHVRFPAAGDDYEVIDPSDSKVPIQLVPVSKALLNQTFYRLSNTTNELVFQAKNVPSLGYKSYLVTRKALQAGRVKAEAAELEKETTIGNDVFKITFDTSGYLSSITVDGETSRLSQNFLVYNELGGSNLYYTSRAAGAYAMRTFFNETGTPIGQNVSIEVVRGELVDEVHQTFNSWISQVVRIYKTEQFVEFEWLVGPIPTRGAGKSVISRFSADIESDGNFYTDSNGREMLRRRRNSRDTWTVKLKERIPGNYYPVTTKIAIEDGNKRLAVLTDRSQGGSSMADGTLELMVRCRRLNFYTILHFFYA